MSLTKENEVIYKRNVRAHEGPGEYLNQTFKRLKATKASRSRSFRVFVVFLLLLLWGRVERDEEIPVCLHLYPLLSL